MTKNGIHHYIHKNSICIDAEPGFIERFALTPANIYDSQMLPILLNPENQDYDVWADSAYSGKSFEDLLSLGDFERRIHEKESRNHHISEAAKKYNFVKWAIRACVKHVFG